MEHYAESDSGMVYIANGFDPILRWDGLWGNAESAGVAKPTTAVTLSGSGFGTIVGTYRAYVRFVDRLGLFSDLSPVSADFTTNALTGSVVGATNATPIVITTSAAHGLVSGQKVKVSGVGGNTGAIGVFTITVTSPTTFSMNDSSGTGTYTGGGTWISGVGTITYTGIPTSDDPKVSRRQILRNTDGQANVYYIDVDTTDISSSVLSSTLDDVALAAQTSVALLDDNGNDAANIHGVPPNHKPFMRFHLGRMYYAGSIDYEWGHIEVTVGSKTVTGIGTGWTSGLVGRLLYVVGASRHYEISSVDEASQTLTLVDSYEDPSDKFSLYAIRTYPGDRRSVYFSEAGLPESVPAVNAFTVPEDGDEITGMMVRGSFLFIMEKRRIWKYTVKDDPRVDGELFHTSRRGCINDNCWVMVDDNAYMLDEEGVHKFQGNWNSEPVSMPIQDVFRPSSDSLIAINWDASRSFHAVLYKPQEVIRWFVCLGGHEIPKHALCFNYRLERWWVEEYPVPIGASTEARIGGQPSIILGGPHRKCYQMWGGGTLDFAKPVEGTVRNIATGASLTTLEDSQATFSSNFVNCPLEIVAGKGKGQHRQIVSVTGTELTLDKPWLILPDTTSVYQVGGVRWNYRSSWFRFGQAEQMADRRFEIVYEPCLHDALVDFRFFRDFGGNPEVQKVMKRTEDGNGVSTEENKPDFTGDMTRSTGVLQQRLPDHKENYVEGRRYSQFELEGVSNQDRVRIYQLTYEGAGNATAISNQGGGG